MGACEDEVVDSVASSESAIDKAISISGGLNEFARKCGVRYQAVQKWKKSRVPAERVLLVESISGISRCELRPDLYPAETFTPSSVASVQSD